MRSRHYIWIFCCLGSVGCGGGGGGTVNVEGGVIALPALPDVESIPAKVLQTVTTLPGSPHLVDMQDVSGKSIQAWIPGGTTVQAGERYSVTSGHLPIGIGKIAGRSSDRATGEVFLDGVDTGFHLSFDSSGKLFTPGNVEVANLVLAQHVGTRELKIVGKLGLRDADGSDRVLSMNSVKLTYSIVAYRPPDASSTYEMPVLPTWMTGSVPSNNGTMQGLNLTVAFISEYRVPASGLLKISKSNGDKEQSKSTNRIFMKFKDVLEDSTDPIPPGGIDSVSFDIHVE